MTAARILLVEDDGLIRLVAADYLRDEGFEVVEAEDGDEAARLLDTLDDLDVLFTDVRMPGALDGIDVAVRARHQHPQLPVLVVSGYAAQLTSRLGALQPPAAFIAKPYTLREIVAALSRLSGSPDRDCGGAKSSTPQPAVIRDGSGNLNRCVEWSSCLTAAKMAAEQEQQ